VHCSTRVVDVKQPAGCVGTSNDFSLGHTLGSPCSNCPPLYRQDMTSFMSFLGDHMRIGSPPTTSRVHEKDKSVATFLAGIGWWSGETAVLPGWAKLCSAGEHLPSEERSGKEGDGVLHFLTPNV